MSNIISRPLTSLDRVVEAMYWNLSNLEHNTEYTLPQLTGKEQWLATPEGRRKQLASDFKFLVVTQRLPVTWVRTRSDTCEVYELN